MIIMLPLNLVEEPIYDIKLQTKDELWFSSLGIVKYFRQTFGDKKMFTNGGWVLTEGDNFGLRIIIKSKEV